MRRHHRGGELRGPEEAARPGMGQGDLRRCRETADEGEGGQEEARGKN